MLLGIWFITLSTLLFWFIIVGMNGSFITWVAAFFRFVFTSRFVNNALGPSFPFWPNRSMRSWCTSFSLFAGRSYRSNRPSWAFGSRNSNRSRRAFFTLRSNWANGADVSNWAYGPVWPLNTWFTLWSLWSCRSSCTRLPYFTIFSGFTSISLRTLVT